jgi:hypothetical protein
MQSEDELHPHPLNWSPTITQFPIKDYNHSPDLIHLLSEIPSHICPSMKFRLENAAACFAVSTRDHFTRRVGNRARHRARLMESGKGVIPGGGRPRRGALPELVSSNNMSGKPTLCPGCHRCNYARGGARSGGDALNRSFFLKLNLPQTTNLEPPTNHKCFAWMHRYD